MRALTTAVLVLSTLGAGCTSDAPAADEADASIGFESIEPWTLDVSNLPDDYVRQLIGTLDQLLEDVDSADIAKGSVFSGQWCGPCRSEYPYQRLMTEVYADRPFAIVGVNSDSLDVAKTYMAENNLDYRSFWDGPTTEGPIATRWHVTGWPTLYVLDPEGRIRFVNVRHEVTLKAVAQLLAEIPREPEPAGPAPAEPAPTDGA